MKMLDYKYFDAVAFDLEGTLANTIPTHHTARLQAFAQHGFGHITAEQHALGPTYGSYSADITGGILFAAGEIDDAIPFSDNHVVRAIVETRAGLYDQLAAKGFEPMPGAIAFLHEIVRLFDRRVALVTSSVEKYFWPFADAQQIRECFPEHLVISHETIVSEGLRGKPEPDPYLLAKKRLDASRLLVFEDTIPGVAAAKQAGATVVGLGFDEHCAQLFASSDLQYPPDVVVRSYEEARTVLNMPY